MEALDEISVLLLPLALIDARYESRWGSAPERSGSNLLTSEASNRAALVLKSAMSPVEHAF
jgi:hypothetical protein